VGQASKCGRVKLVDRITIPPPLSPKKNPNKQNTKKNKLDTTFKKLFGFFSSHMCSTICMDLHPGTPVSSTNKNDRHDITEILLTVALNTINLTYMMYILLLTYYKHQKSGIPPHLPPKKKIQTNKKQKQTNCTLHLNICVCFLPVTCAIASTCNGVQIGNERWKNPCGTQVELISNIISNIGLPYT
jgi:hypothetical protein